MIADVGTTGLFGGASISAHTGGCNSFTRQSLLSAETDPFRLGSQFEFSRTYSHQYHPQRPAHRTAPDLWVFYLWDVNENFYARGGI